MPFIFASHDRVSNGLAGGYRTSAHANPLHQVFPRNTEIINDSLYTDVRVQPVAEENRMFSGGNGTAPVRRILCGVA
jgi:hypothetical protein